MSSAPLDLLDHAGALRRLSDDESPYAGQLHADPPLVWTDLDLVDEQVWRCSPDGHLLVPVDIARTQAGHAALLPHCPDRLTSVVDASPAAGTAVTIAVSMLRAAAEARAHGLPAGSWWVDASGRPVLAIVGTAPWQDEAGLLLARLAERASPRLRDALERAATLITGARITESAVLECEDALFAAAAPAPLERGGRVPVDDHTPRRVDTLRRDAIFEPAQSWISHFTDAEWAVQVTAAARTAAGASGALRDRLRRRRAERVRSAGAPRQERRATDARGAGRRRAPWLVAGAVGTVVIAVGLLWPEPSSTAAAPRPTAALASSPASSASAGATAPPSEGDAADEGDLEAAGRRALTAIGACVDAAAATCPAAMEDAAAATPVGVVATAADEAIVTLLDEYGGVAVLRVEAVDQRAQILVLVSADGTWLVRDVYDVADQP